MAGHVPVLCAQIVEWLARPGGRFLDVTLGDGGHAAALLRASGGDAQLVGVDQDAAALVRARGGLAPVSSQIQYRHANFADATEALVAESAQFDGIVADLGFSSPQIDSAERGFSFRMDGPLDMRMNQAQSTTAATLVNTATEVELADWFFHFGEERASRRIARAIVAARMTAPIETTGALGDVVRRVVRSGGRIDPATRVFQALRIVVNDEIGVLERMVQAVPQLLAPGGRAAILTYHSLEDRVVKHAWKSLCQRRDDRAAPRFTLLVKRPLLPTADEVAENPRARSAKLRGLARVS